MIFTIISLAWQSVAARKTTALLTILAVALSVALFTGVEKTRHSVRASFENTISGVDAIVGGRTGPINLLLFSVFRMGDATSPISWDAYKAIEQRPDVAWTIPISLGDSHKGYRVLGTLPIYFEHYKFGNKQQLQFKSGKGFDPHSLEVVLGAQVAKELGYEVGTHLILSHGLGDVSFHNHEEQHFEVVGILASTGTPVDQTVHVGLEAIEIMHAPVKAESNHDDKDIHTHITPKTLNAVFVGLKSRGAILRFNREVNTYPKEPLLSIIPGMTLASLWKIVGSAEKALSAISLFVVFVGLASILISIFTTLNERRREMAILRSLGARPTHIFSLIMAESSILAFLGSLTGVTFIHLLLFFFSPWISANYGLELKGLGIGIFEFFTILAVTIASTFMSLWPASRATRAALSDGLTIRV